MPYLAHHRVFDAPILPAAAYLEMALAAGAEFFKLSMPAETLHIEEVLIPQALILAPDDNHNGAAEPRHKSLQLVLTPRLAPSPPAQSLSSEVGLGLAVDAA